MIFLKKNKSFNLKDFLFMYHQKGLVSDDNWAMMT